MSVPLFASSCAALWFCFSGPAMWDGQPPAIQVECLIPRSRVRGMGIMRQRLRELCSRVHDAVWKRGERDLPGAISLTPFLFTIQASDRVSCVLLLVRWAFCGKMPSIVCGQQVRGSDTQLIFLALENAVHNSHEEVPVCH